MPTKNEKKNKESVEIDWGIFALVEFIVSCKDQIGTKYRNALDIGSGAGRHTEILRMAGLDVIQLDKYSETAEIQADFMQYEFQEKFDIIFCSHVIEHQRNVGNFLDKIFDILNDDGLLLLSAPKHHAETLIEGHINCFYTSYFVQQLVHAGFDLKEGKYLSCWNIENAAIVSKAKNFTLSERLHDGYTWTKKHQNRSFLSLKNGAIKNGVFFHNCNVISGADKKIHFSIPDSYDEIGIAVVGKRWGFKIKI
ncbi:class I SAM-dependent methyltransferase [Paracoccaceae bacterium]|nr:class I SAM-dependent methyltransferase [Paracoccaceae bacterium]MDC0869724.1 class I SAM-dependent methyltransferase [Paracoccaceae bacterium]